MAPANALEIARGGLEDEPADLGRAGEGAVIMGNATTGPTALRFTNLMLKKNDPTGTYQVGVTTMINSAPSSAATTITVQ